MHLITDIEDKLSVSELVVVEVGPSECVDMSEETSMSGVSINIGDSSETPDIKSEADVLDEEMSESTEDMCCWLVQWCSVSSCSIMVCMVGVGILVMTH